MEQQKALNVDKRMALDRILIRGDFYEQLEEDFDVEARAEKQLDDRLKYEMEYE